VPAPSTRYEQELEIVNHFVDRLERRLAGREELALINRLPIDECHLGVLAPWRSPDEPDPLDPDEMGEEGSGAAATAPSVVAATPMAAVSSATARPDTQEEQDAGGRQKSVERTDDQDVPRRPPSALGCELMLVPEDGKIRVTVNLSFAFYTNHLPTYREQLRSLGGNYTPATPVPAAAVAAPATPVAGRGKGKSNDTAMSLAYVLRRSTVSLEALTFELDALHATEVHETARLQKALDDAITQALLDRPAPEGTMATRVAAQLKETDLATEQAFNTFMTAYMQGKRAGRPDPALQASLTVRTEPQANGQVRVSIYLSNNTRLSTVRTQDNANILADARLSGDVTLGTVVPIEILPIARDYQYDRRVWGVGHNTSVVVHHDEGRSGRFETRALARFDQPRLTTKDHLPTDFLRFDTLPFDALSEIHQAMHAEVHSWQDDVIAKNVYHLDTEQLLACQADLDTFRQEVDRFAAGIAALRAQPQLLQAFQAMNRVMARIAAKKGFARWRLFQLAFIVTQMPALALREGVSEGVDHLGQPHDWHDDLDIADVLWFPTGGGKTESYLGLICCAMLFDRLRGKTLGVTAWLRFPLRMLSVQQLQRAVGMIHEAQVELSTLLPEGSGDPLLLGYFVGGSTTPNTMDDQFWKSHATPDSCERFKMIADCPKCGGHGTVKLMPFPKANKLRHICQEADCKYVLPVVVTDTEIYRSLPTLIVGTVDKAATIGFQERFGILWAGPRWKCPEHGYGIGDFCIFGCKLTAKEIAKLPPIQTKDPAPSLHIQDELHLLQEELGAFAGHYETLIRYCESQVGTHLKAKVIAATATIEGFEHQTRHLYGVKAARRFPSRGHRRHENFYAKLEEAGAEKPGEAKVARVFVAFRPSGPSTDAASRCARILNATVTQLYNDEAGTLAALKETRTPQELASLRYFYSMSLTYVASLTGGTRVKDALNDASLEIMNGARDLGVRYLSGRSSTGEIANVIDEIESPQAWKSMQHVDALVATNVISHGVDLERCNLMVMEKYPAETAEYIQASSRSGRKKVGLVVVVLPVYNLRASSIYNRFREYHEHLDRMVTPVPVNRFAKQALRRTLSGTIAGLINGVAVPRREGTANTSLSKVPAALAWLDRPLTPGGAHLLISDHLRGAQALGEGNYDLSLENAQQALMDEAYEVLRDRLGQYSKTAGVQRLGEGLNPKPMTSLRDVERQVQFRPAEMSYAELEWFEHARN